MSSKQKVPKLKSAIKRRIAATKMIKIKIIESFLKIRLFMYEFYLLGYKKTTFKVIGARGGTPRTETRDERLV